MSGEGGIHAHEIILEAAAGSLLSQRGGAGRVEMTLVGHTLTGAALGAAVLPARGSRLRRVFQPLFIALLAASSPVFKRLGGWLVLIGGALAWLSRRLLDSFYSHGLGLGLFWPVSHGRLALPIPWLSVVYEGLFPITAEKIRLLLLEVATFLPLLILTMLGRGLRSRRAVRTPANATAAQEPLPHGALEG